MPPPAPIVKNVAFGLCFSGFSDDPLTSCIILRSHNGDIWYPIVSSLLIAGPPDSDVLHNCTNNRLYGMVRRPAVLYEHQVEHCLYQTVMQAYQYYTNHGSDRFLLKGVSWYTNISPK